ncbi:hypothetical protein ACFY4C_03430 [Actinomadura viridis]|uniref:hypothetical protein n=1 Tax=Actinomadura viridis TaxID=58110 RepID=UPI0036A186C7
MARHRHRLPDLGEVVGGEVQFHRGQRLGRPLAGAGAEQRHPPRQLLVLTPAAASGRGHYR